MSVVRARFHSSPVPQGGISFDGFTQIAAIHHEPEETNARSGLDNAGCRGGRIQRRHHDSAAAQYADRRAEWWRRTTWAVDHTLSDNPDTQMVGYDVLGRLQASRLVLPADRTLFARWIDMSAFDAVDIDADQADTSRWEGNNG